MYEPNTVIRLGSYQILGSLLTRVMIQTQQGEGIPPSMNEPRLGRDGSISLDDWVRIFVVWMRLSIKSPCNARSRNSHAAALRTKLMLVYRIIHTQQTLPNPRHQQTHGHRGLFNDECHLAVAKAWSWSKRSRRQSRPACGLVCTCQKRNHTIQLPCTSWLRIFRIIWYYYNGITSRYVIVTYICTYVVRGTACCHTEY